MERKEGRRPQNDPKVNGMDIKVWRWRERRRDGPRNDPKVNGMERKEERRPQKRPQGHKDGEKGGQTATKTSPGSLGWTQRH